MPFRSNLSRINGILLIVNQVVVEGISKSDRYHPIGLRQSKEVDDCLKSRPAHLPPSDMLAIVPDPGKNNPRHYYRCCSLRALCPG
jgi:hypothetical protein